MGGSFDELRLKYTGQGTQAESDGALMLTTYQTCMSKLISSEKHCAAEEKCLEVNKFDSAACSGDVS